METGDISALKAMPVVTVEQVIAFRNAAIKRVTELEAALMTFLSNSSVQANQPFECESAEKLLKEAK
jgi:hypothetical protein